MTPTEAVQLVGIVSQISPAQRIDEYTADAWHMLLDDVELADALEAVRIIGRKQAFIAPAEVLAEVRRIRARRSDGSDATFVYIGDPDDALEYRRQLVAHRRAIGNGYQPPAIHGGRAMPHRAIANTFRNASGGAR